MYISGPQPFWLKQAASGHRKSPPFTLPMAFLQGLGSVKLKSVPDVAKKDRSSANTQLASAETVEDEASRWKYFFKTGCGTWFETLREHTFRSSFCELLRAEAAVIVEHWENKQRAAAQGKDEEALFNEAKAKLEALAKRLDVAVEAECQASPTGLAFVKLSTRSPKDSKRALAKAKVAFDERIAGLPKEVAEDHNERWKILSEEVARAGAVANGADGVELLLDSERVFEDLEFALRGPKAAPSAASEGQAAAGGLFPDYDTSVVARAWDPRLTPQSEFRGIVWKGKLSCIGQYFHPLYFPELKELKATIAADCLEIFDKPNVQKAVELVGGHCIIDFAWLGKGEVIIVELNPFDGECLGTFPASTGVFLWENQADRAIMTGDAPFEFRIREQPLPMDTLKVHCNQDWRRVIYNETKV